MSVPMHKRLLHRRPQTDLETHTRLFLWALRHAYVGGQPHGKDARFCAALRQMGLAHVFKPMAIFLQMLTALMPEPLQLASAQCRCPIAFHEAMLCAMFEAADRGDMRVFERACGEMLDFDARLRLWEQMGQLALEFKLAAGAAL